MQKCSQGVGTSRSHTRTSAKPVVSLSSSPNFPRSQDLRQTRRLAFFESKFYWFLSSEGILCLQGKDQQMSEQLLLKRHVDFSVSSTDYLVLSDDFGWPVLVKAGLRRGSSNIPRPPGGSSNPPLLTLAEAGMFCLSRGAAWEKRNVGAPPYWIHASQLKIDGAGGLEVQSRSYFWGAEVVGVKNALTLSSRLEMGVGLLFEVEGGIVEGDIEGEVEVGEDGEGETGGDAGKWEGSGEAEESVAVAVPVGSNDGVDEKLAESATNDHVPVEHARPTAANEDSPVVLKKFTGERLLPAEDEEDANVASSSSSAGRRRRDVAGAPDDFQFSAAPRTGDEPRKGNKKGETQQDKQLPNETQQDIKQDNKRDNKQQEQQQQQAKRGQKAKLKKLAKYKDQDDDERALKLALIGAKETKLLKKGSSSRGGGAEARDDEEAPESSAAGEEAADADVSKAGKKGKGKQGKQSGGKQVGKASSADNNVPKPTPSQLLQQQTEVLTAMTTAVPAILENLTGKPPPPPSLPFSKTPSTPTILRAIPVCGPFTALNKHCAFRAKLVPPPTGGNAQKKGRLNQLLRSLFEEEMLAYARDQIANPRDQMADSRSADAATPGTSVEAEAAAAPSNEELLHPEADVATFSLENNTATDKPDGVVSVPPNGLATSSQPEAQSPAEWAQSLRQLLAAVPDNELMNVLVNNAMLQAAGLQKLQADLKKDTKKAKKGGDGGGGGQTGQKQGGGGGQKKDGGVGGKKEGKKK